MIKYDRQVYEPRPSIKVNKQLSSPGSFVSIYLSSLLKENIVDVIQRAILLSIPTFGTPEVI